MSRLGYWCKSCGCFRENIEDVVTRHILASRDILCTEGENPFGNGLCLGFATSDEVRRKRKRAMHSKPFKKAANY